MKAFQSKGSLLALLNRTSVPPNMDSGVTPKIIIANVGANGWADNLKCAIDLFLMSILDRYVSPRSLPTAILALHPVRHRGDAYDDFKTHDPVCMEAIAVEI